MERRVSSLETEVAVLGNRQDTADHEISQLRGEVRTMSAKIHYGQGALGLLIILVQVFFGS